MQAILSKACGSETPVSETPVFDVEACRRDFPILSERIHGKRLVYLDSAATSQKPRVVLDAILNYYQTQNANVHRGVHALSERATHAYEESRKKVKEFINAAKVQEIVFVRGATEAANLVAQSFVRPRIKKGDEILISSMEHHSNIVPWQMLATEKEASLRVIPITKKGELDLTNLDVLLSSKPKILAITHVSNALGTINPIKKIVACAKKHGVPVFVDGAQAAPHIKIDVSDIGADFYTFSSHKMFGPTGIGVLYGKLSHLEEMPPYQGGGEMIQSVTLEKTIYHAVPHKFEAGTPNIEGVIGMAAAIDYLNSLDRTSILKHEEMLLESATECIASIPGVRILGEAAQKVSLLTFLIEGVHAHDLGTILDKEGVAIRTGHHCAQPVMNFFGVDASARASFSFYNTLEEIDILAAALLEAKKVFG